MSELREAIARAIYKAHMMFDPQFCEMCEQDQQAEIDLGWEFAAAEADAALAAIEASGYKVEERTEHAIKRLNIPMLPSLRTRPY